MAEKSRGTQLIELHPQTKNAQALRMHSSPACVAYEASSQSWVTPEAKHCPIYMFSKRDLLCLDFGGMIAF